MPVYSLEEIHSLSENIHYELPSHVLHILQQLETMIILPDLETYPTPPSHPKKQSKSLGRHSLVPIHSRSFPSIVKEEDPSWVMTKSWKQTPKLLVQDPMEKQIQEIRTSLNKLSPKTYEMQSTHILTMIQTMETMGSTNFDSGASLLHQKSECVRTSSFNSGATLPRRKSECGRTLSSHIPPSHIPPNEEKEEKDGEHIDTPVNMTSLYKEKLHTLFFHVISTNKLFHELYAKLYTKLMTETSTSLSHYFSSQLFTAIHTFPTTCTQIEYQDPNIDYDAYCQYIKQNEQRRAFALFLLSCAYMNPEVQPTIIPMIQQIQQMFLHVLTIPNKTGECEEISEILTLMISHWQTLTSKLCETPSFVEQSIFDTVTTIASLRIKEDKEQYPSLSSRIIFSHLNLVQPGTKI
jgi:hypothetical protein